LGDGPFQVLKRINDLPTSFDVGDDLTNLRTNSAQEGGTDEDTQLLEGPMTRARAKKVGNNH